MERFARARERELAGRPLHQSRAQARLKLKDTPAHRGGRYAQPSCGLGKAAAVGHLYEHSYFIQIEHENSFCCCPCPRRSRSEPPPVPDTPSVQIVAAAGTPPRRRL